MSQTVTGMMDSTGKKVKVGDILQYHNPAFPEKEQPLHGVIFYKKVLTCVFTRKRGKKYKSWQPVGSKVRHPERWTIIGNVKDNPELLS